MTNVSDNARNVVECPFCKELIAKSASRCPHCQENVKVPQKKKKRPFWISEFMLGIYAATAFWMMIIYYFFLR